MAECRECGSYTKFNGGLCYKCYKENPTPAEPKEVIVEESIIDDGLASKERQYRYNVIKGRIAETLIQELFLSLKYNVFKYGMENTIPGVMELLKGVRSEVANHIKRMPDFVVQDPETKQVFFIEVKFRANGEFKFKHLGTDYPYENAFIIVVTKKHIKCITYSELKAGKEITPTSKNYLGNRKEFQMQKEVIIDFCKFAVQFFESV